MPESYDIMRYELAAALLPPKWRRIALDMPDWQKTQAEELRLRAGHPLTVLLPEGERWAAGEQQIVTTQDIEQLCDVVTAYSRYAATETMAQGYLSAPGGFRVGLCGTAVMENGNCKNLRHLSSAVIRIAKEKIGLSDTLLKEVFVNDEFASTLVVAPPGAGKTTLLRDMVRNLSNGTEQTPAYRIALVDERGEIAGSYHGAPQLSVGCHTDIMDGVPKSIGILMMLRAVNPQIIAVDEITAREDILAMTQAANCGVRLLATIHGSDLKELKRKPLYRKLLELHVFEKAVVITNDGDGRRYTVEELL